MLKQKKGCPGIRLGAGGGWKYPVITWLSALRNIFIWALPKRKLENKK